MEEAGETFLRDEVEDFLNEIHPYFVRSSNTDGNNQTQVYGGDSTVEDSVQQAVDWATRFQKEGKQYEVSLSQMYVHNIITIIL